MLLAECFSTDRERRMTCKTLLQ